MSYFNPPVDKDGNAKWPHWHQLAPWWPVYGKFDLTTYLPGFSDYEIMLGLCHKINEMVDVINGIPDYLATDGAKEAIVKVLSEYCGVNVKYPPSSITAAVGDGATDDTTSFQSCIDYVYAQGGGVVYVPNGKYLLNEITMRPGVSLMGQDRYNTILIANVLSTEEWFDFEDYNNACVLNFTFEGQFSKQLNHITAWSGTGVYNVLFYNLIFNEFWKATRFSYKNGHAQWHDIVIDKYAQYGVVQNGVNTVPGVEYTNLYIGSVCQCDDCDSRTVSAIYDTVSNSKFSNVHIKYNSGDYSGFPLHLSPNNAEYNITVISGPEASDNFTTQWNALCTNEVGTSDYTIIPYFECKNHAFNRFKPTLNSDNTAVTANEFVFTDPVASSKYFKWVPFNQDDGTMYHVLVEGDEDIGAKVEGYDSQFTEINNQLTTISDNIKDIYQKLENIGGEIPDVSGLTKRVTTLESNVSTLQSNVSALQTNVSTLQTNVTNLTTNVTTLQENDKTQDTNITSNTNRIATLEKKKYSEMNPVNIATLQDLKGDGTDDITDTINTYTQQYPLFIPAGTYLISSSLSVKHSIYGAGSSRDATRGVNDTILKSTISVDAFSYANETAVINVRGTIPGNLILKDFDIVCNSYEAGIIMSSPTYTDNHFYNLNVTDFISYAYYVAPGSTLSRYIYFDNCSAWAKSSGATIERYADSCGYYISETAPDTRINDAVVMCTQHGMELRTNVYGCNWHIWCGGVSGSSRTTESDEWWHNTWGVKVYGNDVHVTNLYLDTCRYGIILDGPNKKSAIYINNLIYTVDDSTASSDGTGTTANSCVALRGTAAEPQLVVNGGVINRTAHVAAVTQIYDESIAAGSSLDCKFTGVYMYGTRDTYFTDGYSSMIRQNSNQVITSTMTDAKQYEIPIIDTTDSVQYRCFAMLPMPDSKYGLRSIGTIKINNQTGVNTTLYLQLGTDNQIAGACINDARTLTAINSATAGSVTPSYTVSDSSIWYSITNGILSLFIHTTNNCRLNVTIDGFTRGASPAMFDTCLMEDGTQVEWPAYTADAFTGTNFKQLSYTLA